MTDLPHPKVLELRFRRPGWPSSWFLWRVGWILMATAFAALSPAHRLTPGAWWIRVAILNGEAGLLLIVLGGWQLWLLWKGGPRAIRLGAEVMTLPRGPNSIRSVILPYRDVRSATVLGHGWRARLIVDTARGAFVFPVRLFTDADAVNQLQSALRDRILALPDGTTLWRAVLARHDLAAAMGTIRPWGSWGAAAILCLCFAAQSFWALAGQTLADLDAGANAGFLVWDGEWFRVVTASLLHVSLRHLLGNCLVLLIVGTMLERMVGNAPFILILLVSGIVSQLTSATAALYVGGHIISLGVSGAVFGILGALIALTLSFRKTLPGGYKLSWRVWVYLIGISILVLPQLQAHVDKVAHLGGLLTGLFVGGLLSQGCATLRDLGARAKYHRAALAFVALVWAGGLSSAWLHLISARARSVDRYALAQHMLTSDRFPAAVENLIAWSIATDREAPRPALENARLLAHRGVSHAQAVLDKSGQSIMRGAYEQILSAVTDTEASLDYRLGFAGAAANLEATIAIQSPSTLNHMTIFLDRASKDGDWKRTPYGAALPTLQFDHGTLRLNVQTAPARGWDLFAVIHHGATLAGLLLVRVPYGFSGEQVLPLPDRKEGPSREPPSALWVDGKTSINVAWYGESGEDWRDAQMGPFYNAFDSHLANLP